MCYLWQYLNFPYPNFIATPVEMSDRTISTPIGIARLPKWNRSAPNARSRLRGLYFQMSNASIWYSPAWAAREFTAAMHAPRSAKSRFQRFVCSMDIPATAARFHRCCILSRQDLRSHRCRAAVRAVFQRIPRPSRATRCTVTSSVVLPTPTQTSSIIEMYFWIPRSSRAS